MKEPKRKPRDNNEDPSRNSSEGGNEKMPTFSDSNWAYDNAKGRKDSDGDYD